MQGFKRKKYLSSVKLSLFLRKFIFEREKSEEFSSRTVLEYKVKLLLVLETPFEFD